MCTGRVHSKTMNFTHSKSFLFVRDASLCVYTLMLQHREAQNKNPQYVSFSANLRTTQAPSALIPMRRIASTSPKDSAPEIRSTHTPSPLIQPLPRSRRSTASSAHSSAAPAHSPLKAAPPATPRRRARPPLHGSAASRKRDRWHAFGSTPPP